MIGEEIPPPPQPVRREKRPCKVCRAAIQPGQLYLTDGPMHIGCFGRA